MKILLTGGSGMVGMNILECPEAARYEMYAPRSSELNLLHKADVKAYIDALRPDLIIHAAGRVGGIQANILNPVGFLVDNLNMGQNVITAAYELNVQRVLNVGSSCMYPRDAMNPLVEESLLTGELEPTNEGYALAKIVCARLCEYISKEADGFQYKTIIPCNLFGRYDKFDPINSHMIPAVVRKIHDAIQNGLDSVDIWGDGTARREFMYAGDLSNFVFFAIDKFESIPQYINVGTGRDYSINEYYQYVGNILGYSGRFVHDLSKPAGMRQKLVDVSKLSLLGWEAKTSLESGLMQTRDFFVERYHND